LAKATAKDRQKMLAQIDRDIEKELQRRMRRVEPDSLMR
jgi:pheromone shutdown protein TraB